MQLSKTMMVSLLISAGLLSGSAFALSPTPNPTVVPSYPAWDSASTYTAGQRVTQNGATYEAQWWTKGDNPATAGEWGAWKKVSATPTPSATPLVTPTAIPERPISSITDTYPGTCTPPYGPPSWQSNQQYVIGSAVSIAGPGIVFKALAAHLSSNANQPRFNSSSNSVSYDANLWQALKLIPAPCQPPSPTPTAMPTPTPTASATPTATPSTTPVVSDISAWNTSTVYTAGKRAIYNGRLYEAKWYTVGENPSTSGPWGVWKDLGPVTSSTPTPSPTATPTATPVTSASPSPTPNGTTPSIGYVQTTKWKDGAAAAYTMFHDDFCSYGTEGQVRDAAPALKQRGLTATFGVITSNCNAAGWTSAKQMIAEGHEMISHTRNHTDANSATWDAATQISGSSDDMAANLDGYRPSFLAWPSDVAADGALAYLRTAPGYIGGRAPNRVDATGMVVYDGHAVGVNAALSDDYQVQWDLYTDQGQWSLYEAQVKAGGDLLNLHVDAAINAGAWATRTMHGVNDASWMSVPLAKYTAHLDYLKAKVDAGVLWVSGPSNVIKYRYARDFCKPILSTSGASVVTFDTSAAQCKKYATPITLQAFALNAASTLSASQNGKALSLKAAASNSFLVTVDPLAGPVTFSAQ